MEMLARHGCAHVDRKGRSACGKWGTRANSAINHRTPSGGEGAAWERVCRGGSQAALEEGEEKQPPRALPARGPGPSDTLGRPRPCEPGPLVPASAQPRATSRMLHEESSACLPNLLSNVAGFPDRSAARRRGAVRLTRTAHECPRRPVSERGAQEAAAWGPRNYTESFSHKPFNCSLLETIRLPVLWSESRVAAGNPLYEFLQRNTVLTYAGPTEQIRMWRLAPEDAAHTGPPGRMAPPRGSHSVDEWSLVCTAAARTGTGCGHLSPHQAGTPAPAKPSGRHSM